MRKCVVCEKGELMKVEDIVLAIEGYVFVLKGEICSSCNEEFPYEEETQKAIIASRKLGIWPEPVKNQR